MKTSSSVVYLRSFNRNLHAAKHSSLQGRRTRKVNIWISWTYWGAEMKTDKLTSVDWATERARGALRVARAWAAVLMFCCLRLMNLARARDLRWGAMRGEPDLIWKRLEKSEEFHILGVVEIGLNIFLSCQCLFLASLRRGEERRLSRGELHQVRLCESVDSRSSVAAH